MSLNLRLAILEAKSGEQTACEFGTGCVPNAKGFEGLVRRAAQLTKPDGILLVSSCVRESNSLWTLLQSGLRAAQRNANVILESGATVDAGVLAIHDEHWYTHSVCLLLD